MSNGRPIPEDLMSAYRDGELTAPERQAAARLLEESADARTEAEDYQALSELLRGLPDERAPEGLRAAVMQRIERESLLAATPASPPPAARRSRRFWLAGTLLAGSAAGLLVAVNLWRNDSSATGDARIASAPSSGPTSLELSWEDAPREEVRSSEAADFGSTPEPPEAGLASVTNNLEGLAAGRPPAGAVPGDVYSYIDETDDGRVVVIQATVVDVRQALDTLQYLLSKNKITPQTVAVDEYGMIPLGTEASDVELGVLVVSDPEQINAALAEAQGSSLFSDFQVAGVLDRPAQSRARLADTSSPPSPPTPEGNAEVRSGGSRDLAAGAEAEVDSYIAPQARMSIPSDRFATRGSLRPAADAAAIQDRMTRSGAAGADPSAEPPTPSPAEATPMLAATEQERLLSYQQVLNVSRPAIDAQLRGAQGGYRFSRDSYLPDGARYFTDPPDPKELDVLGEDKLSEELGREEKEETQQKQLKQVQRTLRMLVLLEAQQPAALKAKADAASQVPIEAPRPTRKKS